MPLMIIESPNKIKKLTKILDLIQSYGWAVGHFLTLQKKIWGLIKWDTFLCSFHKH